ncbi:MAG: SCP2 sterol-binding domain-containing protein [Candidatus Helarchaeota archaeon]|nr:SCP2 sterol-binding domain-containing protein [Candidatus Helarchaeota archaeon]
MSEWSKKDIIQVKTLLYSTIVSLEIISEEDEMVQGEFGDVEAVIQWKIGDVAAGYMEIKNSRVKAHMDIIHPDPTVIITLTDPVAARDLLNGRADATKLFMKGKILVEGDTKKAMKLLSVNELVEDYIMILTKKR